MDQPGFQPGSLSSSSLSGLPSIVCIRVAVGSQDLKAVTLKNQLRNHGHRLEQTGVRKGVIVGICFDGHQAAGQASSSHQQSKKDGQVFHERGAHGTCYTCAMASLREPARTHVHWGKHRSRKVSHSSALSVAMCVRPRTHGWLWDQCYSKRGVPSRPGDSNGVTEGLQMDWPCLSDDQML